MDMVEWPSTCGETSLIRKRLQGRTRFHALPASRRQSRDSVSAAPEVFTDRKACQECRLCPVCKASEFHSVCLLCASKHIVVYTVSSTNESQILGSVILERCEVVETRHP